ncbi:preprotein translocase subunit SecG [Thalassobaculum sp. OXR-137]|uniref:preprotein translocase subunit SecG n=1 Tax=Thalassobaculum sp. OXR-137 TaxID=3100173 RepID=UPI002AC8A81F|nr:preprotein translocase subunit SecG [Thalassobaculum sp. OXR-137]WPZ33254.1 preprotein translocase subunit SecG [Thalassobaculum sp. OXR-137]
MQLIILTVHLMIALALIVTVLLQRSEGGGLGIGGGGGGGGGLGSFMSARGTANLLTRTTAILAACFMATSLTLAILASQTKKASIVDQVPAVSTPAEPTAPAAPLSQ